MISSKPSIRHGLSQPRSAGKRSIAKYILWGIMIMVVALIVIQFWSLYNYVNKSDRNDNNFKIQQQQHKIAIAKTNSQTPKLIDWTMWSKEEAYFRDCELHYKGNDTWGEAHAPYVDKVQAKNIIKRMNIPQLKIVPTLAVLNKQNITKYTLDFMRSIEQPYIIKSAHVSGGVARVFDNKYHCFKYCENQTLMPLGQDAFVESKKQWELDLALEYSTMGGERQYKYIPKTIIIEEDIISSGKTNTDVTFWWVANSHPVFVSDQCEQPKGNMQGFQMKRVFVGTDHRRLPIVFNRGVCDQPSPKPKSWETQLEVVQQLGKEFPNEVVRIDLYGGGSEVYFSEFTFTTAGCWRKFTPMLTDGILYGLMKNKIPPETVTPESLEATLSDKSWVLVSLDKTTNTVFVNEYPSPVDLCQTFNIEDTKKNKDFNEMIFSSCIQKARQVYSSSLRCIVSKNNRKEIESFGLNEPGMTCQEELMKRTLEETNEP